MNKNKQFIEENKNAISFDESKRLYEKGLITKQEHIKNIETYNKLQILKADEEYKNTRNKNIALGLIDIGVSAIPSGAGAALLKTAVKKGLQKAGKELPNKIIRGVMAKADGSLKIKPVVSKIGDKLAETTLNSSIDGAITGALHGSLTAAVDNKNPIKEGVKDAVTGAAISSLTSFGAGKIIQKAEGKTLKNIENIKELRRAETDYYKNYNQGRSITHPELGKIDFTQAGLETVSRKTELARDYDSLIKEVREAKYIGEELPSHTRKDKTVKFHTLENNQKQYLVAEADNGQKKYYLTKKADGPEARPSRGGAVPSASNNIIAGQKVNFNPSKILDNKNFQSGFQNVSSKGATISALNYFENDEDKWTEEKHKNFLEGFASNRLGNPEKYPFYGAKENHWTDKFNIGNPKKDKGHWVTLDNGKHLFIKD